MACLFLTFRLGHWLPYSASVPGRNAGRILPGPYRIEKAATWAAFETCGLRTETSPRVRATVA